MEKFATPEEVLAQIRRMSIEDREYVEAELMRDAYESGRATEPPRSWTRSFVVRTKRCFTPTKG